jgi:hypothetical protein
MATYVNNLRLKEIATGDESGTWGTSTNTNLGLITDGFSYGTKEIAADANETFTMPDATADATRSLYLKFTSAVSLTATREITLGPNTVSKTWIIENATTGSQIITIKQGSGATVDVANGSKVMVVTDGAGAGAAVLNANPTEIGGTVTSVGGTGTVQGLTLSGTVTSSGNLTLGGSLADVDLTSQVTGTLPIANGGTGTTSTTFADLTTNVTGTLPVANGGTGATTITANNVVLGNGTSAVQVVAPGTSGNVLTSDGTTWASTAPAAGDGYWKLVSTTTASGASTIDIEDFSANYEAFKIVFRLSSSSAINAFRVQLNIGGTYRTSAYKYLGVVIDRNNGTDYTTTSGGNSVYINVFEGVTLYTDQPFFGELTFPDVNSLVRHVMSYDFTSVQNSNEPHRNIGVGHYPSLSGSTLSGARLSLNTGTLDGTVLFYGLIS